ncbi:hypothetical protein Pint_21585 [Pistacia integerrima]|uniref:Uncharacterized protein n=1 Tax=Pistacia integerrima TaxID=434235 RepID=A0ACC0XEK4_9ROSI|nr:hypothetical protein Pint_21585 [Pistacia integerrima]
MQALTVDNNGHHVEPEELIDDYWPFESRKSTVKNMGEASKDVNTYMMGVSGMGGVGKNTFVKEVGRKAMKISYLRGGFRRGMMIISQIFFC